MVIGVPREKHRNEHRVGLNPFAVRRLVRLGHTVVVESRAGEAAHFLDEHYAGAGAHVVYDADEVYQRADFVCRVQAISPDELAHLKTGSVLCAFQHLAVAPREVVERLMALEATVIGYEVVREADGTMPILGPFSDMAGQKAVHLAAHYLQNEAGGRGILLGTLPGVPPPTVLILGAGSVGYAAARTAMATGAHVIVLDESMDKLARFHRAFGGGVVTVLAATDRLERYTAIADVLIGAILIPGERAPLLVTDAMVKAMKPGSFIIDVSIDQGGCVETSRPTRLDDPTFVRDGVTHYCVPNMTANVARTASRVLANAAMPYVVGLAEKGIDGALREDPGLAASVYVYRGKMTNHRLGRLLDLPASPLAELLRGTDRR